MPAAGHTCSCLQLAAHLRCPQYSFVATVAAVAAGGRGRRSTWVAIRHSNFAACSCSALPARPRISG